MGIAGDSYSSQKPVELFKVNKVEVLKTRYSDENEADAKLGQYLGRDLVQLDYQQYILVDYHNPKAEGSRIVKFSRPVDDKRARRKMLYEDPFQTVVHDVSSGNYQHRQLLFGNQYLTLYRNYNALRKNSTL